MKMYSGNDRIVRRCQPGLSMPTPEEELIKPGDDRPSPPNARL